MKKQIKKVPNKAFSEKPLYLKVIYFLSIHLYILTISFISIIGKFNYLTMTILFWLPPLYFLMSQLKVDVRNRLFKQLWIIIPFALVLETLAHLSGAWFETTAFSFRVLNIFPLESFIWASMYVLFIVSFYEYFFDASTQKKLNINYKYLLTFIYLSFFAILVLLTYYPGILQIKNFYFFFIVFVFLIDIFCLFKYKNLESKSLITGLLLIPISLVHEFASLALGHWKFPFGNHIGYLDILSFSIPIEEIIWFPLIPIAVVVMYELFVDNHRN